MAASLHLPTLATPPSCTHAVNESLVRDTADLMVSHGLIAAGYKYLNLDGEPAQA
jgi:hypothetical protein